jgi:hypothetical protein
VPTGPPPLARWVTKREPVEDAALADDPTGRLRGVLLRLQPHTPTDPKARAVFEQGNRLITPGE